MRVADLAWCAPLALVSAFVIAASRRLGFVVAARASSRPVVAMVVAGLLVGLLALGFREATDRPVDLVLFSGQNALPAIAGESTGGGVAARRGGEGARVLALARGRVPRRA
ncbi:MAG TPA: hypothetical protein VLB31_09695, partial [Actinomycetota bacterium]|nr:hypothetical protein [Actinomycetota bacterium]